MLIETDMELGNSTLSTVMFRTGDGDEGVASSMQLNLYCGGVKRRSLCQLMEICETKQKGVIKTSVLVTS